MVKSNLDVPRVDWRRRIVAIAGSQSFVRVLWILQITILAALILQSYPWMTADSRRYIALAESLRQGAGFSLLTEQGFEPEGWRMPGYPAFIMVCYTLFDSNPLSIIVIQGMLFLGSVWLIKRMAETVWGKTAGGVFLAISVLYPFIAYSASHISAEIPAAFLITLALFLLLRPTSLRFILAGICIGAASYFRPNLLFLIVIIPAAYLFINRRMSARSLILVLSASVIVLPWAFHNYKTFGVFTPLPVIESTGTLLLQATWESRISIDSLIQYGMYGKVTGELQQSGMIEQVRALNKQIGVPPDTIYISPEAYPGNDKKLLSEKLFAEAAFRNMKSWPAEYLWSSLVNAFRIWFSAYLPGGIPHLIRWALVAEGALVLILGTIGMIMGLLDTPPAHKPAVYAAVSGVLYMTFTLCWLHIEARYTIPMRFVLLLFASFALVRMAGLLHAKDRASDSLACTA